MKGHNLDWKKKKAKRAPPTRKEKEVEGMEPVIAEHANQYTATSFSFHNMRVILENMSNLGFMNCQTRVVN
jgi:hypothetical protein